MSTNLAFYTKKGGYAVDFPFQTPTSLTRKVMEAHIARSKAGTHEIP